MKKLILATALTTCLAAPVWANEVTGNVAFTTDYVFRGVSQTDEGPAVQGAIDFSHDSGLHAGVWGSSIDFDNADAGSMEMDLTAGYASEISGVTYDVGGIYYLYPGSDDSLDYDYWELYLSGGYDFGRFAVNASVNYSPEFFGNTGDAVYYAAGVDVPVLEDFVLALHVGYQTIDDAEDYTDWSIGVNKNWLGFDWSATYYDTDLNNNDDADARAVLAVSKTF